MKNKIVTVFGASGFIGTYVVRELAKMGYTIRAVSRNAERAKHLKSAGFVGQVVPTSGDFTKSDSFPELIKGSYAVVNLVGILYEAKGQNFNMIHAQSAERLAKAAKDAGVKRFIHVSAIVNGQSQSKYARSKITGEDAVVAAFPNATILEPSIVFGAEDNFFNFFARLATFLPVLPLIGGGQTKFQPVYVGDVAKAVAKSIDDESIKGKFELGGPEVVTFRQCLDIIMKYTGRRRMYMNEPFPIAKMAARFMPKWLLTSDQVELLKHDNVVNPKSKKLFDLGIKPTTIEAIVPSYLDRYSSRKKFDIAA